MPFPLVRYHRDGQVVDGGERFEEVNEKGYVPVRELDNGERLTEVAAVLQYIADQRPDLQLAPPFGSLERYRLQEWLNFLGTEVHKSFWPFFHEACETERPKQGERFRQRPHWIHPKPNTRPFLTPTNSTTPHSSL